MGEMLPRIDRVQGTQQTGGLTRVNRTGASLTFSEVLKARLENEAGLKFSAHAMERLRERGVNLGDDDLARLSGAVSRADEKGANDSLILINDLAFIVSIKNQTVVTALSGDSIKDNVFTNIDSTVIA